MKNKTINSIIITAIISIFLFACSNDGSDSMSDSSSGGGQGGSMARFTIQGDYLYTVDHSKMKTFDISNAQNPLYLRSKDQQLNSDIETIFTMDTLLFIGSQSGMYIYNIKRPDFPQQASFVSHIRSCDPVVAEGKYAYVTLNSENTWCGRMSNELQIYNITNPYQPQLVRTETGFTAPRGLGVDGNKLFICDNGLKVYDITNPEKPIWIDDLDRIPEANEINTYDVIPLGGILLVVGADGLYQFDYTGERIKFVSKIAVSTNY